MFILRNASVWIIASLTTPSRPDVRLGDRETNGDVVRFMNDSVEISGEFSDLSESRLNGTDDRARKLNHRDLKLR